MTARYRSREKISVTLTLMPSHITCVIAASPWCVAGILMYRLSRFTVVHSRRAISVVAVASRLSRGSTSIDTHPASPAVCACTGARTSQAVRTSSVVTASTAVSTSALRAARSASWPS